VGMGDHNVECFFFLYSLLHCTGGMVTSTSLEMLVHLSPQGMQVFIHNLASLAAVINVCMYVNFLNFAIRNAAET